MKNKTSLALIEQAIMILVFVAAAALCLRAFVWADGASRRMADADRALVQAQSAAEITKHHAGDLEKCAATLGGAVSGDQWQIDYDENWSATEAPGSYALRVKLLEGQPLLGSARVQVLRSDGEELASLTVSWQEVAP